MLIRQWTDKVFYGISMSAALLSATMLVLIVAKIGIEAIPSLNFYFLTTAESDTPGLGQGIANAVAGTFLISLFSTILAAPLGVTTAIYLRKYAKDNRYTRMLRFLIEVLSGTPSIVLGIFGLLVLVYYLKPFTGGFSLLTGTIALTILIVPVIERAAEDAIQRVPKDLEESSFALGATKWQTIRNIVLPVSMTGIMAGTVLGFGRAAEESAVVILTAGYSQFMPEWTIKPHSELIFGIKLYPLQDLVGTLPYSVYHAYEHQNIIPVSNAFAAAFVLIVIVFAVNLSAKSIFWYSTRSIKKPSPFFASLKNTLALPAGGLLRKKWIPGTVPDQKPRDPLNGSEGNAEPVETTSERDKSVLLVRLSPSSRATGLEPGCAGSSAPVQPGEPVTALPQQEPLSEGPAGLHPAWDPEAQPVGDEGSLSPASASGEAAATARDPGPAQAAQQAPGEPMPVPGVSPASTDHSFAVPPPRSRDQPSIMDGFFGVILASASMVGFLGLVYGIRIATKDASLEVGEVLLVAALIAVVGGVAAFQYVRLHRRAA